MREGPTISEPGLPTERYSYPRCFVVSSGAAEKEGLIVNPSPSMLATKLRNYIIFA